MEVRLLKVPYKDPLKKKENAKQYYSKHEENIKYRSKRWREEHRETYLSYMRRYKSYVICFLGRRIKLDWNPRKGICSECGAIKGKDCKKSDIHHLKYIPCMVWACTIELCSKCHDKTKSKRRGQHPIAEFRKGHIPWNKGLRFK